MQPRQLRFCRRGSCGRWVGRWDSFSVSSDPPKSSSQSKVLVKEQPASCADGASKWVSCALPHTSSCTHLQLQATAVPKLPLSPIPSINCGTALALKLVKEGPIASGFPGQYPILTPHNVAAKNVVWSPTGCEIQQPYTSPVWFA